MDYAHQDNSSILQYNDENSLACVLSLAYVAARKDYVMVRELPTGKGFADIVLVPRRNVDKPAVVLELKYDKSADAAIKQIKEKRYGEALRRYVGEVVLVGIDYDKETKRHECVIERMEKGVKSRTKTTEKSRGKTTEKSRGKTTEKIIEILRRNPKATYASLALMLELTEDGISYQIKKLKRLGLIERDGGDNGGRWIVKIED